MKTYLFKLSVVAGVLCGLYVYLYNYIPITNLLWMTFIALPIFFGAGAKRQEFPHYVTSLIVGIIWGYIYLKLIGLVVSAGVSVNVALLLVVGVVTLIMCAIHLCVTGNTCANKLPIMFGAVASMFSQNGESAGSIFLTLFGGLLLALLIVEVTELFNKPQTKQESNSSAAN
ncbi:MAG: DUF1097 domain-containing protein [Dehalobacterium sp.]